jgi:hypothetical protein
MLDQLVQEVNEKANLVNHQVIELVFKRIAEKPTIRPKGLRTVEVKSSGI